MAFEENQGQSDPSVRFTARGKGYSLFLAPTQAVWCFQNPPRPSKKSAPNKSAGLKPQYLWMKLKGANPKCGTEGLGEQPGKSNYLVGNNPSRWKTNIPQYSMVKFTDIYPKIDLLYYGVPGKLEYDFVVNPGGNPGDIRLAFQGAQKIETGEKGGLEIRVGGEKLELNLPEVYQEERGQRRPVVGRLVLRGREVGFEMAPYDPSRPLVIDPTVAYSTYVGGGVLYNNNELRGMAVDPSGFAYLIESYQAGFPTTPGVIQPTAKGFQQVLVLKLNQTGTALIYCTYLGGSGFENGEGIAADAAGNAFVTGATGSTDFPVVPGAYQTTLKGSSRNAFVAKLNPSGTTLLYSTYLGGSYYDTGESVALDALGNAYVAGETYSSDFPVSPGAIQTTLKAGAGQANIFLAKLNPLGTSLLYSTYLGGSVEELGPKIAVDSLGDAFVTGFTWSNNFPVTPGAFQPILAGSESAFVSKINSTATALLYSTYLGGSSSDFPGGIAVDPAGDAYVIGTATSINFL